MKNLTILSILLISSLTLSKTSSAAGSCSANYSGVTTVQCSFNGDANALDFFYKSVSGPIYLHFWGEVKAGGSYIYNYITTPSAFYDLALHYGEPAEDYWEYGYEYTGTILLYTESVGSANVGGVEAIWW